MTEVLISASHFIADYWYLLFASPVAVWLFVKIIQKNKTGEYIVDWIKLRIPVLGKIIRKAIIARISRTLGTLIASGVPILDALIIARDTAGNAVFRKAFEHIYAAIREGEPMAVPLKETRIADDIVVNMVDVGEETGALDDMLYKVADVYDEEVRVLVDGLIKLHRAAHHGRARPVRGLHRDRPLPAADSATQRPVVKRPILRAAASIVAICNSACRQLAGRR